MVKASKNKLLNEEFEMKLELNEVLVQSLRYFAELCGKVLKRITLDLSLST